MSLTFLNF